MKKILLSLAICASCNLYGQFDPLKESEKITPERIRKHIETLAHDSLEGRKTSEKGQKIAAAYIVKQFEENGLAPVNIQGETNPWHQSFKIEILKDFSYIKLKTEKSKENTTSRRDLLYFGPVSFKDTVTITYEYFHGQIPVSGNGLYFRVKQLQDGITLINESDTSNIKNFLISLPDKEYKALRREYNYLSRKRIILKINDEDFYKVIFMKPKKTNSFLSKDILKPFLGSKPKVRVIVTSEEFTKEFFKARDIRKASKGNVPVTPLSFRTRYTCAPSYFTSDTLHTENVIAKIEGTDKRDEAVVICGHYDHLGIGYYDSKLKKYAREINNGADDNASGTSAVIETARLFAEAQRAGFKPKRTLLFIAFTGEEEGLMGSEYYAFNPVVPIEKTYAVINLDMIGRTNKFYTESDDYVNVLSKNRKGKLNRLNRKNGKLLGLKIDFTPGLKERFLINFGSDHRPFVTRDVPAIVISTGDHPDYHTPADDADKINYRRATLITRLAFLDAWILANE